MVRRLCYPTVPDNAIAGDRMVPYSRGDVYIHPTTLLDYTTRVEHRSLVQANCSLGKSMVLTETLLGAGCRIGEGCQLRGCVIGDDVTIGCGCVLSDCVIMSGTCIDDRVQLDRCTLGNDVVVKEGVTLTGLRIHKCVRGERVRGSSQRDMTDEEMDEIQWDEDDSLQAEEKGQGFILRSSNAAGGEAPRLKKWSHASLKNAQGWETMGLLTCRFESEDDEEDEAVNGDREVYNGLLEYVRRLEQSDGNTLNDVYMEINCYRMAVNCQYDDIVRVGEKTGCDVESRANHDRHGVARGNDDGRVARGVPADKEDDAGGWEAAAPLFDWRFDGVVDSGVCGALCGGTRGFHPLLWSVRSGVVGRASGG